MQAQSRVMIVHNGTMDENSIEDLLKSRGFSFTTQRLGALDPNDLYEMDIDCLIFDLSGCSGAAEPEARRLLETMREIKAPPYLLVVSDSQSLRLTIEAIRLGAIDNIEKPLDGDVLAEKLAGILELAAHLRSAREQCLSARSKLEVLSAREREIFELVTEGWTSKEAARILDISFRTVQVHRANISRKLALSSLAEMVALKRYAETWLESPHISMPEPWLRPRTWGGGAVLSLARV